MKWVFKAAFIIIGSFLFTGTSMAGDLTGNDREVIITKLVRVEERITALEQRITDLERKFDQRFTGLERKFDQRFQSLENLIYVLLAGIMGLIGFVLWDRRSTIAPVQRSYHDLEMKEA